MVSRISQNLQLTACTDDVAAPHRAASVDRILLAAGIPILIIGAAPASQAFSDVEIPMLAKRRKDVEEDEELDDEEEDDLEEDEDEDEDDDFEDEDEEFEEEFGDDDLDDDDDIFYDDDEDE